MANKTTDASFEKDVLSSEVPVLVDFWAEWCGPCRMLGPILEKLSTDLEGKARVYKLNVDENPATAQKFGITAIPTVLVFKNGRLADQLIGVQPPARYLAAVN